MTIHYYHCNRLKVLNPHQLQSYIQGMDLDLRKATLDQLLMQIQSKANHHQIQLYQQQFMVPQDLF